MSATSVIQKAPYETNAVIPKVFPEGYSKSPATNWAKPPKKRPIAKTAALKDKRPALQRFRRTVVRPKPIRPIGPGLARRTAGGVVSLICLLFPLKLKLFEQIENLL